MQHLRGEIISLSDGVSVEDLDVCYGSTKVLHHLNLFIPKGKIFGLLGPSGCGKVCSCSIFDSGQDNFIKMHPRKKAAWLWDCYNIWTETTLKTPSHPGKSHRLDLPSSLLRQQVTLLKKLRCMTIWQLMKLFIFTGWCITCLQQHSPNENSNYPF